jgi:predicted amidophosphoribosyltransferase
VPLGALLDVLLPPACAACGLPGAAACAGCRAALEPLPPPWCGGCGAPVPVPVARCPECRGRVEGARQALAYRGPVPALMAALKDGRRRGLVPVLGELTAAAVPAPPAGAVLVPVPLGPRRARERGFNQSLLLARALGRAWGAPVADVLVRVREGPPQRGAARSARGAQAYGAFAAAPGVAAPAVAWLVDDVRTTGATLADCARALRAAGARRVGAVCLARALPGPR